RQGSAGAAPLHLWARRGGAERQRLLLALLAAAEPRGPGRRADRARRDGRHGRRPEHREGTASVLRDSRRQPDCAGPDCVAEEPEIRQTRDETRVTRDENDGMTASPTSLVSRLS